MAVPVSPSAEFLSWRREFTNLCNDFDTVSPNVPPYYDPLHFRFNQHSPCYEPSIVSSRVASAESLIAQYGEISHQLQCLQSMVQKQKQSLELWTDNHKSLIAPIRLLSPDLIDLIMEHTAEAITEGYYRYDPAVRFTHVCSTWRTQALNHPVLWSKFLIYPFPIPKSEEIHHMIDRIEILVSRSHPLLLELTTDECDGSIWSEATTQSIDDIGLDIIIPPILESLLHVSDRLKWLDLGSTFLYPSVFPKMNLPVLSNLNLSGTGMNVYLFFLPVENVDAIFLAAPQLRHLIVGSTVNCHWEDTKIPWERLLSLEINVAAFLGQIPVMSLTNLTKLVLNRISHVHQSVPAIANLPLLDSLAVEDLSILKQFETPRLTSFIMVDEFTDAISRHIQNFLRSSACCTQLTHLTLIISPTDIIDVIDLLQCVPELESLDVKGWVKDEGVDSDEDLGPDSEDVDSDEEPNDDDSEQVDGDDSDDSTKHGVYPGGVAAYLDGFTELFSVMTCSLDSPDLGRSSSPVILPKLKYLTLRCPRMFRQQLLTMVQSRCHPPHKLLRLELRLCKVPEVLTPEQVTSLLQDWDGIRDDLLRLMKDGKMDVRTYNSD